MDDNRLDELLTDAVLTYRPPPDASLDVIWSRVEAEAFRAQPSKRAPGWRVFVGAIAATLLGGVLIAMHWNLKGVFFSAAIACGLAAIATFVMRRYPSADQVAARAARLGKPI